MWTSRFKRDNTGWHESQTMRMRFVEKWYHRFARCRYKFVYKVDVEPYLDQSGNVAYDRLKLNGHSPADWLQENARGRIATVTSYTEHMSIAIKVQAGVPVSRTMLFTVNFSDKSLALQWKLTWGGKMVDGKGMSLSLAI